MAQRIQRSLLEKRTKVRQIMLFGHLIQLDNVFFFITKFVYRIRFYLFILYCFNKVQYEP